MAGAHRIDVTTVADLYLRAADRFADRPAVIFPERRLTYAELIDAAWQHARSLRALGVDQGSHVGILMANCPEYVELLLGTCLLGACAVPMNARYKPPELAYVVENADLEVIVTSDRISEYADFAALLHAALPGLAEGSAPLSVGAAPRLRAAVMLGGSAPAGFIDEAAFVALASSVSDEAVDALRVQTSVRNPAIMMYTSGTTAHPKGCPLDHEMLVRNGINMNRTRYFLDAEDVFWAPLPMFHMAAILPMLACADAGAAMASMTHIEAGKALDMLERERVTVAFPAFPTVTNELINHPRFASADLSRIRRINNVAPVDMLVRFQDAFPQAVQTGAYGLTECGGVISFNHPDEPLDKRLHTCGVPFPGISVRIVDPDSGEDLPAGTRGELWAKGYCVFAGYYKSPEKNAEAFADGWFRTGDLCSLDEDGAIRFHGRLKDMLKVGGENVAALEIESHLSRHPAVALAQVIGRPDARLEEVPVAFIELKPGMQVSEDEIIDHCKGQLASFKVPRAVRFVQEWPMSSTKVQKYRLRELLDG